MIGLVGGTRQAYDKAPPPQHGILAERCSDLWPYRVQRHIERRRLQRGTKAQIEAKRPALRRVGEMEARRSVARVGAPRSRAARRLGRELLRSRASEGDGVATDCVSPDNHASV